MALSGYDQNLLTAEQQSRINKANAIGESTGDWNTAHSIAEGVRAEAGYSGGAGGDEYVALNNGNAPSKSISYDFSDQLRAANAANTEAQLAGLKSAYQKNMADYDAAAKRLPQTYNAARNETAAQNALQTQAFNERAAASGLNSGASGQAALTRSSVLQGNLANIAQEQANAQADIDLAKSKLQSEYENAIVAARANGDASLANALYQEMVRVQGLAREDEQIQYQREQQDYARKWNEAATAAELGDYSYYNNLGINTENNPTDWERRYKLALLGAQYGDYSGINGLGINTSALQTAQTQYGGGRSGRSGGGAASRAGSNAGSSGTGYVGKNWTWGGDLPDPDSIKGRGSPTAKIRGAGNIGGGESALYGQLASAIGSGNLSLGTVNDAVKNSGLSNNEKEGLYNLILDVYG